MDMCVVVFMDLDGALWDHEDISQLTPPFKRLSNEEIVDSSGVVVRVHRIALELLDYASKSEFILSTLSWNNPSKALEALRALGLEDVFHYHAIEDHPNKALMAKRVVEEVKKRYEKCRDTVAILYIDDRVIHLEEMRREFKNLLYIKAWESCKSPSECVKYIEQYLLEISSSRASK